MFLQKGNYSLISCLNSSGKKKLVRCKPSKNSAHSFQILLSCVTSLKNRFSSLGFFVYDNLMSHFQTQVGLLQILHLDLAKETLSVRNNCCFWTAQGDQDLNRATSGYIFEAYRMNWLVFLHGYLQSTFFYKKFEFKLNNICLAEFASGWLCAQPKHLPGVDKVGSGLAEVGNLTWRDDIQPKQFTIVLEPLTKEMEKWMQFLSVARKISRL